MPSPYPIELRTRVLEKIETGMRIVEASMIFNVHRETIANWIKTSQIAYGNGSIIGNNAV